MAKVKRRLAILSASTVEVLCPECSAQQPAPDNGSDMWTPEQIRAASARKWACVSCDAPLLLTTQNRVGLS